MNPRALANSAHRLFIGTYTKSQSRGIYAVELDASTGSLSEPMLAAEIGHPSFLALSPDKALLFSVSDSVGLAASFKINPGRQLVLERLESTQISSGPAPSHITVDHTGRVLFVSHYGGGYVASLAVRPDGTIGLPGVVRHHGRGLDPVRQSSPHP